MSWFLIFLLACGGTEAVEESAPEGQRAKVGKTHEGHHRHKAKTSSHRFDDPEQWSEVFDDPERDAWQKPDVVVAALDLQPGETVADIGAGTGYFNPHLAAAVGDSGTVIPVDIEPTMVTYMTERVEKDATPQVKPRLGQPDDPMLEESEVDAVLIVDTYHHIEERETYFGAMHHAVRPGGRLVVVDFRLGDIPVGPPEQHRLAPDVVVSELESAGWTLASREEEALPYQYVLTFTP